MTTDYKIEDDPSLKAYLKESRILKTREEEVGYARQQQKKLQTCNATVGFFSPNNNNNNNGFTTITSLGVRKRWSCNKCFMPQQRSLHPAANQGGSPLVQ
ncbi:hypothetical protein EJ110_NYTH13131 [Nymphaea thermarum]|nr:hypothetical protein EJ110_NYTH13131 [Nymphaea thermarum]